MEVALPDHTVEEGQRNRGGIMKMEGREGETSPEGRKYVFKGAEYFGLGPI